MSADKIQEERIPENSIEFRLGVFALTILAIVASCLYVKTSIPFTCFYVWGATAGSYVAYRYRNEKNPWTIWIVIVGTLLVTGNCLLEVLNAMSYGPLAWLVPLVHQLAGMLALHTFEMKSRKELNVAALVALLLLCLCAPVARGIDFGLCVLAYISIGALVLYFDNRSLTLRSVPADGPPQMTGLPQVVNLRQQSEYTGRPRAGKDALIIAILPLISIIAFMFVPRNDFLFDWLSTEVKRLTENLSIGDLLKLSRSPDKTSLNQAPSHTRNLFLPPKPKEGPPKPEPKKPKAIAAVNPPSVKPKPEEPKKENRPGKKPKKEKHPAEKAKKENRPGQKSKKENRPGEKPKKEKPVEKAKKGTKGQEKQTQPAPKKEAKCPQGKTEQSKPKPKPKQENKQESKSKVNTALAKPTENTLMFKVSGNRTVYSRQNCFDHFDGKTWSTTDTETKKAFIKPDKGLYDLSKCDLLDLEKGFPSVNVILQYSVENDLGTLMPVGGMLQKLDYSGDSVTVDVYRRLLTQQPLTTGAKYKVFSLLPVYDQKKMRLAEPLDPEDEKALKDDLADYLQVPEDEDSRVADLAHSLTDKQGNWFRQCELITHYLRKKYQIAVTKPELPEDSNTVDQFLLETKSGDCKDFASSFVILARMAGIPARFVAGYAPGTANAVTGKMEVRLKDAHAWGEAYIPGYDWVPFDATPTGYLPDRPPEDNFSLSSLQKKLSKDSRFEAEKRTLSEFWERLKPHLPYIAAGVILLALTIAGIIVGRKKYMLWLKERSRPPSRKIYLRVMNKLKKAKLGKLPSETSPEFVERLRNAQMGRGLVVDESLTKLLAKFLDTYGDCYFGDQPKSSELQELGTHLEAELQARRGR